MVAFNPILSYVKTQKIYKTINLNFHIHWYISDKCYQYVSLVIKTRLCFENVSYFISFVVKTSLKQSIEEIRPCRHYTEREREVEVSCRNPKLRVTALNDLWDKQHSVKVRLCLIHYVQVREKRSKKRSKDFRNEKLRRKIESVFEVG